MITVIEIDDKVIDKNKKIIKKTKISNILGIIIYLLILILLITFRTDKNHQLFMIISIVITTLYLWFVIFSLDIFIINKTLENKWLSYYSKIKTSKDKTKVVLVEKGIITVDKKQYYKVKTTGNKTYLFLKEKYNDDIINQSIVLYYKDNIIVGYHYEWTD